MGLVYSDIGGITVATNGADEQAVRRELKLIDDRYRLSCELVDGQQDWIVVCHVGSERGAEFVCSWRDEYGRSLPLSSGLVEKVKRLRSDSRWREPDALELNDRLREQANEEIGEWLEEIARDGVKRMRRSPALHRSKALQQSRAKARERGEGTV